MFVIFIYHICFHYYFAYVYAISIHLFGTLCLGGGGGTWNTLSHLHLKSSVNVAHIYRLIGVLVFDT